MTKARRTKKSIGYGGNLLATMTIFINKPKKQITLYIGSYKRSTDSERN